MTLNKIQIIYLGLGCSRQQYVAGILPGIYYEQYPTAVDIPKA